MSLKDKKLFEGEKFTIHAVGHSNKTPVERFFKECKKSYPKSLKKLFALLKKISNDGINYNTNHSRPIREGMFELKADNLRLLCFYHGKKMILLVNGFLKGPSKTQTEEINKAAKIKKQYISDNG